ncbi:hypothetical protein SAMN05192555_10369 [Franzmannia pantelleriensis]|uniref:WD40-like Beta Propeller Repeat n=1 Tax=Franzmannia pantelleriensis TaxID=48727 RepID=A0A1G9I4W3_9GAMM|nr:hypothetical protein [Halomonas pantelleriensis]SDL20287.1 hypothetical protein SAMN05192555_10369 [Halomonas pantelleriensis]
MRIVSRGAAAGLVLAFAAGCSEPQPDASATASLTPLAVTDEAIRGADDGRLLDIGEVPSNIHIDDDAEFGAAQRFVAAELSPDESRIAVATQGAAHAAGWLLAVEDGTLHPAAFQYGGEVEPGPWRDDGAYVVFALEGPAPSRTLVIVEGDAVGETVEANARPVRIPEHAESIPAESEYRVTEWHDDSLLFDVDGESYRLDPASGEVR